MQSKFLDLKRLFDNNAMLSDKIHTSSVFDRNCAKLNILGVIIRLAFGKEMQYG